MRDRSIRGERNKKVKRNKKLKMGERNKKLKTPEWTGMEKAEQKGSGYHIF